MEHVLLLSNFGNRESELAAILDLVALERVVVTGSVDFELLARVVSFLGVRGVLSGLVCGGLFGSAIRGAGGEDEGQGGESGESGDTEAVCSWSGSFQ